jgi:hypothetical protein
VPARRQVRTAPGCSRGCRQRNAAVRCSAFVSRSRPTTNMKNQTDVAQRGQPPSEPGNRYCDRRSDPAEERGGTIPAAISQRPGADPQLKSRPTRRGKNDDAHLRMSSPVDDGEHLGRQCPLRQSRRLAAQGPHPPRECQRVRRRVSRRAARTQSCGGSSSVGRGSAIEDPQPTTRCGTPPSLLCSPRSANRKSAAGTSVPAGEWRRWIE